MHQMTLAAHVRENRGKGVARKLRKDKQIPSIFYGPNSDSVMLAIEYAELANLIKQSASDNLILDLQIKSEKGIETKKALLKDLQIDPVKDSYIHADFYEISMEKEISVDVPVRLLNTPSGGATGGVLQQIRRKVTISCLPDKLVASLDFDVSEMEIGDSLRIRDLDFPEGVHCAEEGHLTVAVVAVPTVTAEETKEEEEEAVEEEAAASDEEGAEESKD